MKRNYLFAVAAFITCCFGGWACGNGQGNPPSTYYPTYTDTNIGGSGGNGTGTNDSGGTTSVGVGGWSGSGGIYTQSTANTGTGTQPSTSPLPGTGGIARTGGGGSTSTSVQPDAGTPAPNCGGEYQLPCGGACNPGVRQEYVGVVEGTGTTTVLWCVPCLTIAGGFHNGATACSNLGLLYNVGPCEYYIRGRGVAAAGEPCDGVDNDCSGLIDDQANACASKGIGWECLPAAAPVSWQVNGFTFATTTNSCKDTCVHSCEGKACGGDDGCGTQCNGSCPLRGQTCGKSSLGSYSCGTCSPTCVGVFCGDSDGCGKSCMGKCLSGRCLSDPLAASDAGSSCDAFCDAGTVSASSTPIYTCKDPCAGKACGDADGYGGKCSGSCPAGQTCSNNALVCVCAPDCANKACGSANGCGGTCNGTCPSGSQCSDVSNKYQCVSTAPACGAFGQPCGPGGACCDPSDLCCPAGTPYANRCQCAGA